MESKRLFLKAVGGAALLPAATHAAPAPARDEAYFPNVVLQTHEGRRVRFYDDLVKGRKVMFNMMYTVCTGICPMNTASLLQVQQMLGARVGREYHMYSLTLRPELDTPAALRDYMKLYGIKPGWTYLTGRPEDIDLVRRKLGFYDSDPVADKDINNHTGVLRVGDDKRNKWFMTPIISPARQLVHSIVNL